MSLKLLERTTNSVRGQEQVGFWLPLGLARSFPEEGAVLTGAQGEALTEQFAVWVAEDLDEPGDPDLERRFIGSFLIGGALYHIWVVPLVTEDRDELWHPEHDSPWALFDSTFDEATIAWAADGAPQTIEVQGYRGHFVCLLNPSF